MAAEREMLQSALEKAFSDSEIALNEMKPGGDYWEVSVKSPLFSGKNRVLQHRMVSDALKELNIHALSIKTFS